MSSELLEFLRAIHANGGLEILDSVEPDHFTARLIEEAKRLKLIQDKSSGWNASSTYVLTRKGLEAAASQS